VGVGLINSSCVDLGAAAITRRMVSLRAQKLMLKVVHALRDNGCAS